MSEAVQPWWRTAVIYQVYPRSFADSNGDGIGDLPGITAHLDHVAMLGADAIWLSPIYVSPFDDNGYDIADYEDIAPTFGTMGDFEALVAAAGERGIRIVMDLVVNHTSDEHAWFTESASSRESATSDWYIWRDPRDGHVGGDAGAEPNNWEAAFYGPAWTWVPARKQYYLHTFARKQPDLNWENPDVRAAVYAMMNGWLDRGVEGFRMDVINMISKVPGLPDGELKASGLGDFTPYVFNGPRLVEYLTEMRERVWAHRDNTILTVGETPNIPETFARQLTGPGPLDMVFQFEHVDLDRGVDKMHPKELSLPALKESLSRWQTELADEGWNSLYFENHDQPRSVSRWGSDGVHRAASAKALLTVLHLMRGTPYVYEGQELGMTNMPFASIDDLRDIESTRYYADTVTRRGVDPELVMNGIRRSSRDNARTPMQWSGAQNAGFTTGEPWIAVNPNYATINAASQVDDPSSVFSYTRELIRLRHEEPIVVDGRYALIAPDDPQVFAYLRRGAGQTWLVLVNMSDAVADVPADVPSADWTWVLHNLEARPERPAAAPLVPWEARVLRTRAAV